MSYINNRRSKMLFGRDGSAEARAQVAPSTQ
jgi:hypothetical protein